MKRSRRLGYASIGLFCVRNDVRGNGPIQPGGEAVGLNNVNTEAVGKFLEEAKADPGGAPASSV